MNCKNWRCKHCKYCQWIIIQERRLVYCEKKKEFPKPSLIEFFGCDNFEDNQIDLLEDLRSDK